MRMLISVLTKRSHQAEAPAEEAPSRITREEIASLFAAELSY
ncbi:MULTISPECIES: hypothetical protein [unclassified Roseovarius]|nr:hypothetical protein [Roseovarius sp. MMSF_3350]